jgi:hypothetical protein
MSVRFPNARRVEPDFSRAAEPPAPASAVALIADPRTQQVLTSRRDTDAHTALVRGLAEYVAGLSIDWGGRDVRFAAVVENYAEPEDGADYPRAAVYGEGQGTYDASRFTPRPARADLISPIDDPGVYLVTRSEYRLTLLLEAWATDKEERAALRAMLEDALSPVEFMYGARLVLPHYHGMHADYELLTGQNQDDDATAIHRWRRATLRVAAQVPVVRPVSLPLLEVRADVQVEAGEC